MNRAREFDPFSKEVAVRLLQESLAKEEQFTDTSGVLRVEWPSANRSVKDKLVLDCGFEPSLHWFMGYFFDFPSADGESERENAARICRFLSRFFSEEIACGVKLREGVVVGGGPVWLDDQDPAAWWNDPAVVIRSWRGAFDRG